MVAARWSMRASINSRSWAMALAPALPISRQQVRHRDPFASTSVLSTPRLFTSTSAFATEKLPSPGFKKPEVLEWHDSMPINKAGFIGTVVRNMQIQYLDSGKVVANSSLRVQRPMRDDTWFYLEFWGDLAEVAAAHLKLEDMIFVSGCVWPEQVACRDGLEKLLVKVVVRDLKFVKRTKKQYSENTSSGNWTLNEMWTDLFDNRDNWIDDREHKPTGRHPDFRHKFNNDALWFSNAYTPDWVKQRLKEEAAGAVGENDSMQETVD